MKSKVNVRKNECRIWMNEDGTIEWHYKNLKPSELCLMAAVLQQTALEMLGEDELEQSPKRTSKEEI